MMTETFSNRFLTLPANGVADFSEALQLLSCIHFLHCSYNRKCNFFTSSHSQHPFNGFSQSTPSRLSNCKCLTVAGEGLRRQMIISATCCGLSVEFLFL